MCAPSLKPAVAACAALAVWALSLGPASAAMPGGDEALFVSPQVYTARDRRDPFVQPQAGRLRNVMNRVDIEVLRLSGVISHPRRSLALFATQTGPHFGYLLKGGKLYRENQQPVPGISGTVVSRNEVMLVQGDKKITFRLRE